MWVLADPRGRGRLDLLGLLEELLTRLGELGKAASVELDERAAQLGVGAIEAPCGRGAQLPWL